MCRYSRLSSKLSVLEAPFNGNLSLTNIVQSLKFQDPHAPIHDPSTAARDEGMILAMASSHRWIRCLALLVAIRFWTSCSGSEQMGGGDAIYYSSGFSTAKLRLDGDAFVHPNGLLQLTNTSNQQMGHAVYSSPLQFRGNSSAAGPPISFSTAFVVAAVPVYPKLTAHGLAFTISLSPRFSGAMPSQYLGIFNSSNNGNPSNHVLAIELDTLLNPELGDIDNNHVGIDVNGLRSNQSAPAAYYSTQGGGGYKNFSLSDGEPIQVWVEYDAGASQLNVTISPWTIPKPARPLLSFSTDLSSVLEHSMYVGFSASTGGVSGSHYVLGWSFRVNGKAQELKLSQLPSLPRRRNSKRKRALIIGLSLGSVFTAILVVWATFLVASIYTSRKQRYAEVREEWEEEYGPHRLSYKDLFVATKGFSEGEILGTGGFGKVYRGMMPKSNAAVAVKRISHESKQGMKEFIAEISSIGKLRHRNLVQLLGYCRRERELLLVYDFMPNGSLDKFLFGGMKPALDWGRRYKILRGVASGLLYLHEEWEQVVLHRDVKASNVMLDSEFNGKLGDFGLSRLYDHGTNPQTSHVVGTLGYLAHELTRTGKATTCSDVYSFGMVLLEVACGRRPIDIHATSPEEINLVDWVSELWKNGALLEARDCKLGDDYSATELELVLKLGLLCSHPVPSARPTMRVVTQIFNGDSALPEIALYAATTSAASPSVDKALKLNYFPTHSTSSEKTTECLSDSLGSMLSTGR